MKKFAPMIPIRFILPALFSLAILQGCSRSPQVSGLAFGKASSFFPQKSLLAADTGFLVYDPAGRRVIYSHQAGTSFIPSSITKVATTAAALDVLGPDYRFRTELAIRGTVKNGTLHGALCLKGYGDPFLHPGNLLLFADALEQRGITNVKGSFLFDETFLPRIERIDRHMDIHAPYNPGVGALSSTYNGVVAFWHRNYGTGSADIFLSPQLPMHRIRVAGKIGWGSTRFSLRKPGEWTLQETPLPRGKHRLPVFRPGLYTASILARLCAMRGITLPSPRSGKMPEGSSILYRHRGKPLADLVGITLDYSDNLMAELLLLQTVKALGGKPKTLQEAGTILEEYYRKRMPSVRWKGLRLANGSGLTPENRITPEQMTAFLHYALRLRLPGTSYQSLLSASGFSYSLLTRLNRPGIAYRVWAKTGTIYYSVTLTGVIHARSGRKLLFTVMASDEKLRRRYEQHNDGKTRESSLKEAIRWIRERRERIDRLVSFWVKNL